VEGTSPEAQLAVVVAVNGRVTTLQGFPGQSVTAVVDAFMAEHGVPDAFKKALTNEVVDAVLGIGDPVPLSLSFDPSTGAPLKLVAEGQGAVRPWLAAVQPVLDGFLPPGAGARIFGPGQATGPAGGTPAPHSSPGAGNSSMNQTERQGQGGGNTGRTYVVDLYVNKEPRPLVVRAEQDLMAAAREWCVQQGTQEAEHVQYVYEAVVQHVREQQLRDELNAYESRVHEVMVGLEGQTMPSFIPSGGQAQVRAKCQQRREGHYGFIETDRALVQLLLRAGLSPTALAETWCKEHNVALTEVPVLALMVAKHYDEWRQGHVGQAPSVATAGMDPRHAVITIIAIVMVWLVYQSSVSIRRKTRSLK
jgi:hypothetical protein